MAFPDDLGDVALLKIHPAIGIARISNCDEFQVFGSQPQQYKHDKQIKRQAVQFRIFAYGADRSVLGELTAEVLERLRITAAWKARVANRKMAYYANPRVPLDGTQGVISATASSDVDDGQLVGSLPDFEEGQAIPLGQISSTGLFVPPKGSVHRRIKDIPIPDFPADSADVVDTTCDGEISVELRTANNDILSALPACIIVAPPDFSPDVESRRSLRHYLVKTLGIAQTAGAADDTPRALDRTALKSCTSDFAPGFEVAFGGRGEISDVRSIFYRTGQDAGIDPDEVRVKYQASAGTPGAVPGQLTSGLCSTWQGDFTACVGYWTENLPPEARLDDNSAVVVQVFRRKYDDHQGIEGVLTSADDFERHVDKVGVLRMKDGVLIETERDPGDDLV